MHAKEGDVLDSSLHRLENHHHGVCDPSKDGEGEDKLDRRPECRSHRRRRSVLSFEGGGREIQGEQWRTCELWGQRFPDEIRED